MEEYLKRPKLLVSLKYKKYLFFRKQRKPSLKFSSSQVLPKSGSAPSEKSNADRNLTVF
jgi:hypothetical protein